MKTLFQLPKLVFLMSMLSATFLHAQEGKAIPSIFDHFISQEIDELVIATDLALLTENVQEEPAYQTAQLTLGNKEGKGEEWEIELRVRGKFRLRHCDFPPVKLNFSKKDLTARGFASHDKYKLVTHCSDDRLEGKENLLREFTAYQLYNTLTPNSYRVHLVRIKYVDSKGVIPAIRRYGFLIENTNEMAERLGLTECEDCRGVTPSQVDHGAENLHAVFQYMIGNTDFNLAMIHNINLFEKPDGKLLPIGYDFDFSAFVGTDYAVPASHLGQTTVWDRIFLGLLVKDSVMEETLAHFETLREELYGIVRNQKGLSLDTRLEMLAYLDVFYDDLASLKQNGTIRTYTQMRHRAPAVVPPGARPEDYGVRK